MAARSLGWPPSSSAIGESSCRPLSGGQDALQLLGPVQPDVQVREGRLRIAGRPRHDEPAVGCDVVVAHRGGPSVRTLEQHPFLAEPEAIRGVDLDRPLSGDHTGE
jgi:hypothetical protein